MYKFIVWHWELQQKKKPWSCNITKTDGCFKCSNTHICCSDQSLTPLGSQVELLTDCYVKYSICVLFKEGRFFMDTRHKKLKNIFEKRPRICHVHFVNHIILQQKLRQCADRSLLLTVSLKKKRQIWATRGSDVSPWLSQGSLEDV